MTSQRLRGRTMSRLSTNPSRRRSWTMIQMPPWEWIRRCGTAHRRGGKNLTEPVRPLASSTQVSTTCIRTLAERNFPMQRWWECLLYTSDAADDLLCVDLGGRRIIKKKKEL